MRRFILASLTLLLLGAAASASADHERSDGIQVMTQNQYIGADLFPLIPAYGQGHDAFNTAVLNVIRTTAANRTAARVKALTDEIVDRNPDLVGVQEAWSVTCEPANKAPCTDRDLAAAWGDHLELMKHELGGRYRVAGVVENFKIDIPFYDTNFNMGIVHVLDRDAILYRKDVSVKLVTPASGAYPCKYPSADGCNYDYGLPLDPLPGYITRGFVVVDAKVDGKAYRFVNTHLENGYADGVPGVVQSAQALQLIKTMLGTTPAGKRLIIVGDTNSAPNDPVDPSDKIIGATPYQIFAAYGMYDAWLYRSGHAPGLSCCQLEDLSNPVSILSRRIDLILSGQVPDHVGDAGLIGADSHDRIGPPGRRVWPSDHAAVAAELEF